MKGNNWGGVLSFLLPGLGSLYRGRIVEGYTLIVAYLAAYVVGLFVFKSLMLSIIIGIFIQAYAVMMASEDDK